MPAESIHKDNTVTLDQLSEVLDSGAVIQAKNLLNSLYPSEIADVIESTPRNRRDLLWTLVSDENKGETLAELNDDEEPSLERAIELLKQPDNMADFGLQVLM